MSKAVIIDSKYIAMIVKREKTTHYPFGNLITMELFVMDRLEKRWIFNPL